ncbi:MAG: hypothetical protein HY242_06975 [Afipia sp.]|nr:hypothetical protein [Afipia sp.]
MTFSSKRNFNRVIGLSGVCSLAFFLSATSAICAGAPAQLLGKSISVGWAEGRSEKTTEGQDRYVNVNVELGIYVSTSGRLFSQGSRTIMSKRGKRIAHTSASSKGPDGSVIKTANAALNSTPAAFHFEGHSLMSDKQFKSGARRVTIKFDDSYQSCSVEVSYGKEEGAPGIVMHGLNTKLRMLTTATIAGQRCSIRDGNMFGE